jgi:ABC-type Fe3+/spermidine/putrescine transport system ATPase subunit
MVEVLRATLAATGTTTVHVTHDREEAWLLAGLCAVMDQGRIRQCGRIEAVFRRPTSRFTAEFLGGANVLPAVFPEAGGAVVAGARLPLSEPASGPTGHVVLRPEDLAVVRAREGAHFEGTLLAAQDRGAYASLRVRLATGETVVAHVPPADARGLEPPVTVLLACRAPAHPVADA